MIQDTQEIKRTLFNLTKQEKKSVVVLVCFICPQVTEWSTVLKVVARPNAWDEKVGEGDRRPEEEKGVCRRHSAPGH